MGRRSSPSLLNKKNQDCWGIWPGLTCYRLITKLQKKFIAKFLKALFIEPDKNKQCNLAVCLMQRGKFTEAKSLLQDIRPSPEDQQLAELPSYIKSFDRASELLVKLESIHILSLLN